MFLSIAIDVIIYLELSYSDAEDGSHIHHRAALTLIRRVILSDIVTYPLLELVTFNACIVIGQLRLDHTSFRLPLCGKGFSFRLKFTPLSPFIPINLADSFLRLIPEIRIQPIPRLLQSVSLAYLRRLSDANQRSRLTKWYVF